MIAVRVNIVLITVFLLMSMGIGHAVTMQEQRESDKRAAKDVVQLDGDSFEYSLGKRMYILVDEEGSLTIGDVHNKMPERWEKSNVDIPSFGFSGNIYWAYIDVNNNSDQAKEWLLELAYPELDKVHLYFFSDSGDMKLYRVSSLRPFNERPIQHRNFVFPLQFEAHQQARIYMQVDNEAAVQLPLKIWSERKFLEADQLYLLVQGLFFGAMMVMVIYNLFVYFSIRDRSYLFYVLYVAFFSLYQFSTQGLAFQYLWPEAVGWGQVSSRVLASFTVAFTALFIIEFLGLRKHAKIVCYLMQVMVVGAGICVIISYVFPAGIGVQFIYVLGSSLSVLGLYIGFDLWRKGHAIARYFSIAFTCLFVGVLLFVLNKFGVIPRNIVTERAIQLGALLEVFLLSLALAERINRERRKRYAAQNIAIEKLAEKEKVESQLAHQVLHDSLIGCPNRALLKRRMEALIVNEPNQSFAVLLLQLARFHEINNTLGHQNGDEILKRVARRLSVMVNDLEGVIVIDEFDRKSGGYAIVDGVSFGIMLRVDNSETEEFNISKIDLAANKILQALSYPFEFKGLTLEVSAKVGVSLYPEHGQEVHVLLQHAHVAVEVAHKSNDVVFVYSPEVDPYSARRLVLVGELRRVIVCNELQLYYQPQLDLDTNAVIGAEALLRWKHPAHGFIPPDEFVLIAEQTGLIKPLTRWVLENAIRQASEFLEKGHRLKVSVNLSAKNLQEQDLVKQLLMLLDRYNVPPSYLVLEITETAIMLDPNGALETLCRISECGIGLSIDDFGTGYSSLSYLKRLPVNEIKIDRTFVSDMSTGSDDEVIVNTTLNMSHNLGLKVVAEGVENKEVLTALRLMGCDVAQGYYFSKPVPVDEFEVWLNDCGYVIGPVVDINQSGSRA